MTILFPVFQTLSSQAALTYDEVVREMMLTESQYIRDLNMIIKVHHDFPYYKFYFKDYYIYTNVNHSLLWLQVFRAPFVEAKDLFTNEVCTQFYNIL